MKFFLFLFLFLFFSFSSFTLVSAFDNFILSVEYTPGYCNSVGLPPCKPGVQDKFVLHGLWPSDNLTPPFQRFKISYLPQALRNDLHQNWENIYKANMDESFWRYEWDVHGNFSGMTVFDYFQAANQLFLTSKLNNLPQALARYHLHLMGQIRLAISQTTNFADVQVVCRDQQGTGQLQITELKFNFTPGLVSTNIFP